ncbi:ComEC/Rec2 family competence protein [Nocardioides cheoyonin]|uniref:ComEC/Rec2 family competence protein n=1 Tax=Nocardioides cheoyonin TaxID=3156615 RepID=UPI0032B58181
MKDLRLPALGAAAWLGALAGPVVAGDGAVGLRLGVGSAVALGVGLVLGAGRRRGARATAAAVVVVLLAAGGVAALHIARVDRNPVAALARAGALVHVTAEVTSDPRTVVGAHDTEQLLDLSVREVSGRGQRYQLHTPVLALGGDAWREVPLGATVQARGELAPARSDDVAALFVAEDPSVVADPGPWWGLSAVLRGSIRDAVAHRPADERALVPALVDGDDAGVDDALADEFRTTGLTHLLAVSGTNLTLVVGFLLVVARWCRARGRWLYAVGAVGIVGFVLLARTEPSVVRAAAMGAVGLLAMGHNGRQRALRGLGASVLGLLLLDPGLARSMGFALSVVATTGILLLGPPWRDALARWLPRWLAEAIAVPAAAQLACTPLIAAISAKVSLVAVVANLLAEPAVAPATVLGLLGGVLGLAWAPVGALAGTLASWCVGWIIAVAHHCARLPTADVGWGSGPIALLLLVALCCAVAVLAPRVLRHRLAGGACCVLLVVALVVRPPTPGWPPDDWVLVMCDVGQGDGLALATGPHSAVIVDTGPDPDPMDQCLDDLDVTSIPLLVLTHFHADHVDGIDGALDGRTVGEIWTTRLQDPPEGVAEASGAAAGAGLVLRPAPYAGTVAIGPVTLQVLWPLPDSPTKGPGDGSTANAASVVLLVESHGLRMLLTGDVEPDGQEALARALPGLHVDVLKVPHHGSRYQDEDWLLSLHPRVALTSVGADNDYGHPAASTLDPLEAAGVAVYRTDEDGSVAVVATSDGPAVATH